MNADERRVWQTRVDQVHDDLDAALAALADTRLVLAAIVVAEGGEVRVPSRVLVAISRDTRIESHTDPIDGQHIYRVQIPGHFPEPRFEHFGATNGVIR